MKRALALNAAIVASIIAAGSPSVPGPLRMIGAALVVLVFPGLGWLGAFRRFELDPPRAALAVVGVSSLANVAGLVLLSGSGLAPSPWIVGAFTLVFVNAGLLSMRGPGRFDPDARWGALAAVALAGSLGFSVAALHLVPPLEDHDMEVRGTALGLVTDLKPYFLTNREIYLPMAHPILFHGFVAESLVLTREIEAVRPSYDSARRAEAAEAKGDAFPWMEAWRADYEAMLADPALAGTRAPGILLAGLALALLFDLVFRFTGSSAAAYAAVVLYASFPETIVRSSYAGYFSPAVFAMLVATGLLGPGPRRLRAIAAAGALMAWLDHKTVVFAAGVAAYFAVRAAIEAVRVDRSWDLAATWRRLDPRPIALGFGFAGGTAVWWLYGLSVSVTAFWNDHIRMHLLHRMILDDLRVAPSTERYAPSMAELWIEFGRNTGYAFLPVALIAAGAWLLLASRHDGDGRREALAAWAFSVLVAFTLTNWRQTKHLMNGLAPLVVVVISLCWPAGAEGGRRALRIAGLVALASALAMNLAADVALVRDFGSLTIRGSSDIDGW